jgi:hypothetical protein
MEIIVYLVAYIVNILIVGQPRQAGIEHVVYIKPGTGGTFNLARLDEKHRLIPQMLINRQSPIRSSRPLFVLREPGVYLGFECFQVGGFCGNLF